MNKQEFFHKLEEIIAAPSGSILGNESLKDLPGWDSMASVAFIAMADETMAETVSASRLAYCKSVVDLVALFPGKIS